MKNVDYILLLDADMVLYINPNISISAFKEHLQKGDAFYIMQGTNELQYKNIRIVKNIPDLHYFGVTHEHLVLPKNVVPVPLLKEQVFIQDIGDGGSKQDKFPRDIKLLQDGLIQHPGNSRYLFYLANSYKNNNQFKEAIETYLKRVEAGDWIEEVWYSYYNIGHCYYQLKDFSNAIYYWLEAHHVYPRRIENLYQIIRHYRIHEKYELAYSFYLMAKRMLMDNTDHNYLFTEHGVYTYKLDYEYSIIAYYCKCDKTDVMKTSLALLDNPHLSESIITSVMSNYKYYAKSLIQSANNNHRELIGCFSSCIQKIDGFQSSSPSICKLDDTNYLLNIRYVNYIIDANGIYVPNKTIQTASGQIGSVTMTRNVLYHITHDETWKMKSRKELTYDKSYDTPHYQGLEDVRLFSSHSRIIYTCNRGVSNLKYYVEMGHINPILGEVVDARQLHYSKSQSGIEKNWVFMPSSDNNHSGSIVYSWHPLVLGNVVNKELIETHRFDTPRVLRNLRGSCHGICINDEVWFLCHMVSYETLRYYYHCFVVLDASTYAYKKHTQLFTFEKVHIEYCTGISYEPTGDFIIGYSTLDKTTRFMSVAKATLE